VTCLNMMLTQRFAPEDERREAAFLWNYAGMNIGFFIGFAVAGHYQLTQRYPELFWFATVGNAAAIALTLLWWKSVADRDTPLLQATARPMAPAPAGRRHRHCAAGAAAGPPCCATRPTPRCG
jgi:POT family proton-dependent oligopeptide transporter